LPKDNPFLGRRVLIIVSGGIAAYKTLDLIRRLREKGAAVRCVLTRAGAEFVTPLSLAALSEDKVYQSTFDLKDESEMGHVRLSREADILLVCPATANILAKMASGIADDLASTLLLATDKPVMVAPAMNVRMWDHAATRTNMETLKTRGVTTVGPLEGPMACNEFGVGRLAEPEDILAALADALRVPGPLNGLKALVTSGPTHEPIDPVRYIANRSSGKQGHAIARALRKLGAETTLVSGPTREPNPVGVRVIATETARQMLSACETALPADIAVCAAAVADWRVADESPSKLKKDALGRTPAIAFAENPDILKTLSELGADRPRLVVGFAAETDDIIENAKAKLAGKGCDWIVANDVSNGTRTLGGNDNQVYLVRGGAPESWPPMSKVAVADKLAFEIAREFSGGAA